MEFPNLEFDCTNESIDSVVKSLSPREGGNILAICGSGDVPFALVEHADVTAIDILKVQIDFARYRADGLRQGDYARFLERTTENDHPEYTARDKYFSEAFRKEAIKERLGHLTFEVGNIFETDLQGKGFNKIYLSNAISYGLRYNYDFVSSFINRRPLHFFSQHLQPPGLIYLADYYGLPDHRQKAIRRGMQLDFGLTRTASKYYDENNLYRWKPAVFRLPKNKPKGFFCFLQRFF